VGIVGVGSEHTQGKIESFKLFDGLDVAPFWRLLLKAQEQAERRKVESQWRWIRDCIQ
jgi:hypothetical protein